jgi:transcriptional regulator with XRE-family HTH domain
MELENLQLLGLELARLRKARKITQKELGALAGLDRSTIAKLEVGHLGDFGVRKLMTLLNAMNCSLQVIERDQGITLDDLRRERERAK